MYRMHHLYLRPASVDRREIVAYITASKANFRDQQISAFFEFSTIRIRHCRGMLIPLRATCRTIARPSILLPKLAPQVNLFPNQLVRHKTSKRKRKLKPGEEKAADRRLRLKKQFKKDMEKKRFNHEKRVAADRAKFRLPPHEPRPDAVPFGTAIRLLRGWLAPADIFVRSKAAPWAPETMVIAMVRVVPNDNNPRTLRGRVKFPHPVVDKSKEGKKERIVAIAEGAAADQARQAGMVVGGQDYLDKVSHLEKLSS